MRKKQTCRIDDDFTACKPVVLQVMETPVALLVFNRPAATEQVLDAVRAARPSKLLVIADGPRPGRTDDEENCAAVRAIIDRVDWNCDVIKNYSDINLGVGTRPATGLRWVFDQVEQAIVLEDDCVAHPTFFRYCDELLDKYRDDKRVMHVSGDNWNFCKVPPRFSYFFSWYCYSCGWATWRRAFQHYDPEIKLWGELRQTSWMLEILGDAEAVEFWSGCFDKLYTEGVERNGWDWPWLFACWAQRGLSILPRANLVTNIGFGADATHTTRIDDERAFVPGVAMEFPLTHPPIIACSAAVDRQIVEQVGLRRQRYRVYRRLRRTCLAALPKTLRRRLSSATVTPASRVTT